MKADDPEDPALLTLQEFIKLAADRGKTLWVIQNRRGDPLLTDGDRRHALPALRKGGLLPSNLVTALCELFRVPKIDAALNWPLDD